MIATAPRRDRSTRVVPPVRGATTPGPAHPCRLGLGLGLALALALVLVAAIGSGCRAAPAPLSDTAGSEDALAGSVLDALASRDRARLVSMALDEREFREHLWPHLPAARPERNLPVEYVWGDLRQKSHASLRQALSEHGGRRFTFERIEFTGETSRYGTVLVHRDSVVFVRDEQGQERQLRLFGSVVETRDSRFKIVSYVVD